MLKHVTRCLHLARLWGLIYRRPTDPSLPLSSTQLIAGLSGLPNFPILDIPGQLIGFVDAAHADNESSNHCYRQYRKHNPMTDSITSNATDCL